MHPGTVVAAGISVHDFFHKCAVYTIRYEVLMYLGPNRLKISGIAGDFAAHSAVSARIGLSDLDCVVETPLSRHQLPPTPPFPGGRGLGAEMRLTFLTRPYSAQDWNARQPARTYRERMRARSTMGVTHWYGRARRNHHEASPDF
jgi:hypothetical protein